MATNQESTTLPVLHSRHIIFAPTPIPPEPIMVSTSPRLAAEELASPPGLCVDEHGTLCIEVLTSRGESLDPRDRAPVIEFIRLAYHNLVIIVTPIDVFVLRADEVICPRETC
jgi:hypothetical protein